MGRVFLQHKFDKKDEVLMFSTQDILKILNNSSKWLFDSTFYC
jgi:hypothetical protein